MLWVTVLLVLIVLVVAGLGNQLQTSAHTKKIENEVIALAAGLRRRNHLYVAVADAELVAAVMKRLNARRRPAGSLILGSVVTCAIAIAILHATAPYPSLGEAGLAFLLFICSGGFLVWSIVNMVRNMRKPDLRSLVEEAIKGLSSETVA